MEFELLGWPEDEVQLRLDHTRFSYAGKFVMTSTGKAVVREESEGEATSGSKPSKIRTGSEGTREECEGEASEANETSDTRAVTEGNREMSEPSKNRPGSEATREVSGGEVSEANEPSTDRTEGEGNHENGEIVAAVAFNEDRTDEATLWLRYVTVRADRRGEGIGPQLVGFARDRAFERGYERLRIAVNNPFAYQALYRAGFGFTGETTGIAELVLEYPAPVDHDPERYREGLAAFRERDLTEEEARFLEDRLSADPPSGVDG